MSSSNDIKEKTEIFNHLIETGCCKRCALRFTGDVNVDVHEEGKIQVNNGNLNNHIDYRPLQKKIKQDPCVVCLDLLREAFLNEIAENSQLEEVKQYDCHTFVNFISFPVAVLIREHAMEIYVKKRFPDFYTDRNIIAINRAWSTLIQNKLVKRLNKKHDKQSNLQIQFTTTYEMEHEESSILCSVEKKFTKLEIKKEQEPISRTAIGEVLKTVEADLFQKHISVPPQTPVKAVVLDKIFYRHEPIFIAGRYSKFSRNLGQTPWIVGNNIRVIDNSVQEIIFEALDNIFNCKTLIFSSSGREDFDVRTLGRGRPFFIKICDPKITQIPFEHFRSIEKKIKQSKLIKVQDLQFIDRRNLSSIKEGEQFKQKTYRALCIVNKPEELTTYIEKINNLSDLTLKQKTPIRVYHRRSSDIREKVIYEIKARAINGRTNLFELDMVTQAGTYIKEFVHGDFGRTKPSLGEIIGGHVDIVTLDVLDIDLDFPPSIYKETEIVP